MKLEELLKVATDTIVTLENKEQLITASAETLLRNLSKETKKTKVGKVQIRYGNLWVMIADESEADRNG